MRKESTTIQKMPNSRLTALGLNSDLRFIEVS